VEFIHNIMIGRIQWSLHCPIFNGNFNSGFMFGIYELVCVRWCYRVMGVCVNNEFSVCYVRVDTVCVFVYM